MFRNATLLLCSTIVLLATASTTNVGAQRVENAATLAEWCGSNVTPEEAERFRQADRAPGPDGPALAPPPYCVPIAAHIVRTDGGGGGISLSQYQQAIDDANFYYQGMDIQFYTLGIDYIDSDEFYYNIQDIGDINALRQTNVIADAINVYFTPNLPGLCGISSFTTSSVQGIVMANGCSGTPSSPSVLAHEIGHYFDLYHTHETAFGTELVNGSNCTWAGDRLCDTPADPRLGGNNVNGNCVYYGGETDPNGDPYTPDPSQIMSYAPSVCADTFSPQSETKQVNVLNGPRSNLLSRGCNAIPAPVISAATPAVGFLDMTLDVTLVGANFGTFTTVDFGEGVTVNFTSSSDPDTLVCNVTIDELTTTGFRDVVVSNAFDPDTLTAGFEVKPTLWHYVAPGGSSTYPYATPAMAAPSLATVVGAASAGDSVLVDSTAVNASSISVLDGVALVGGYADNFTTRPSRTRVNLSGDILMSPASGTATIDGFVLENGAGASDVTPINGKYGGAIRVSGGSAAVTNCEIRNNAAGGGANFGGGGGIYAGGAAVTISGNDIHDNTATYGGGIFLYQCTGTVSGNTISNNTVVDGGAQTANGAGVYLDGCTDVTLGDNAFSGNGGASTGGGLRVVASTGIVVTGGSVSGHTTGSTGAGAYVSGSEVTFDGVAFGANNSSLTGGAIGAEGGADVTVTECDITGNTGFLGAGVYASGGTANVNHNLISGNTATISAGAVYFAAVTGGAIVGNTMDGNAGTSGVGGMLLSSSPVDVLNNIVSSSTGDGINCSGSLPALSYNLVWNSSGSDYAGCSPGTGAVSADPLFVDAPGGDYHLALNSPAIDAGDPAPAYNDPDGGRGDMGRYGSHAFTMEQPVRPTGLTPGYDGLDRSLSWHANPEGDVDFYAIYCDTVSGFVPGPGNLALTTPDTSATFGAAADTLFYVVSAVDTMGYAGGYSAQVTSEPSTASGVGDVAGLSFRLEQNVPNPFNPTTTIRFSIAQPARVTLTVYDVAGRAVRTLISGDRQANAYRVTWDGTNDAGERVASGVYFYRLDAGALVQTRKMVLLK